MFEYSDVTHEIIPSDDRWRAVHTREPYAGPALIQLGGRDILRECRFYVDALGSDRASLERVKFYRKGGSGFVEEHGRLPFGNQIRFFRTSRYASNHLRVTADFNWPRNTEVERHFGLDGVFLPGTWKEYDVIPPILHLEEGVKPTTVSVPEWSGSARMIGHWHRPPLSLVFRDDQGVEVEIGTGMDVWRWERCLGAGPDNGSFKIMHEADGIRFIREPLMCCTFFIPDVRQHRFKWYAAWRDSRKRDSKVPEGLDILRFTPGGEIDWEMSNISMDAPWLLDFSAVEWPASARRDGLPLTPGTDAGVCWQSSAVIRMARRIFRQIMAKRSSGVLFVRGINVGWCRDASHLERGGSHTLLRHWDIDGVLDLTVWARQQLGMNWDIRMDAATADALPVLGGIFQTNGFEAEIVQ